MPETMLAALIAAIRPVGRDAMTRSPPPRPPPAARRPECPNLRGHGERRHRGHPERNTTDFHHPIHLHLAHFQVLSRGQHARGPFDAGWKDTIDLRPAEGAAIAVHFADYPGRYLLHCHNLEHEDMAMMANFTVT